MGHTKVRNYKTNELLDRVRSLPSFRGFPKDDFIIGVRSNEKTYNIYDDKFYHFNGDLKCLNVLTGTTESGDYGFKNYLKWNKKGVAEIKDNECYYYVWKGGLHKNKMKALRQVGYFKVIRRKSKNDKTTIWTWEKNKGLNFHTNTYNILKKGINWVIGGWSTGCQVSNHSKKYYNDTIDKLMDQNKVSYFLLREF